MTSRGTSMQDLKTKSAAAEKMKTMAIQRTVFGHECGSRGGMFCSELSDIALGVACGVPNFYRKSAQAVHCVPLSAVPWSCSLNRCNPFSHVTRILFPNRSVGSVGL